MNSATVFAISPTFVDDSENSTKVTYLTPKLGSNGHSVQAGITYAPNMYGQGQETTLLNPSGQAAHVYENVIETGARYEGKFMDKVNAAAAFIFATADGTKDALLTGASASDFSLWDIGAQVGYAGFTVGGNYTDAGRLLTVAGQDKDQYVWTIGASYKFDRASLAGSYLSGAGYNNLGFGGAFVNNDTNYVTDYTAWGLGAGYSLFDGMTTSIDAVFFDQDRTGTANDNDGHVVILSNRVAF